jgi:hypothetical protein
VFSHGFYADDVVTFTLPEEDENDDETDEEEDEMLVYEEPSDDSTFDVTVAETNGTNKPFVRTNGIYILFSVNCHASRVLAI